MRGAARDGERLRLEEKFTVEGICYERILLKKDVTAGDFCYTRSLLPEDFTGEENYCGSFFATQGILLRKALTRKGFCHLRILLHEVLVFIVPECDVWCPWNRIMVIWKCVQCQGWKHSALKVFAVPLFEV